MSESERERVFVCVRESAKEREIGEARAFPRPWEIRVQGLRFGIKHLRMNSVSCPSLLSSAELSDPEVNDTTGLSTK